MLHPTIRFLNKNIKIVIIIKGGTGISLKKKMYRRGSLSEGH
jgi:hypothetical protein